MPRSKIFVAVLALLLANLVPGKAWAATFYVDVNYPNPTGFEDGSQQFPFVSIQRGIDAAQSGDGVFVAAGVYYETILMKSNVSVFGAGAGLSIIDGGQSPNSVVTFDGARFNPKLDGFTIRNGKGDTIGFIGFQPIIVGGGIKIINSGPRLENLIIEDNTVDAGYARGGGLYIAAGLHVPTISGSIIRNNTARSTEVPGEGRGGGIYITSKFSSALITETIIEMNVSDVGGGIYHKNVGNAALTVERNDFRYNEAADGAAIFTKNFSGSSVTIVNNLFVGNGSTAGQKDCDDGNGASTPGAEELCNDGIDNDCDDATPDIFDADNDGWMCDVDCNDSDASIHPGGFEQCGDMIDNDCDGAIDFSNPDNIVLIEFGSAITYLANGSDPGLAQTWVQPTFDDSGWAVGTYGIGYEDEPPGATALLGTVVTSGAESEQLAAATNGNLEAWTLAVPDDWDSTSPGAGNTLAKETVDPHAGLAAARFAWTSGTSATISEVFAPSNYKVDQSLSISFWLKQASGGATNLDLNVVSSAGYSWNGTTWVAGSAAVVSTAATGSYVQTTENVLLDSLFVNFDSTITVTFQTSGTAGDVLVDDISMLGNSGTSSVYTRTLFTITETFNVNALFLAGDVDDGHAAWINGVEVFRSPEMPVSGDFAWDTAASAHESSNGLMPDYGTLVDISTPGLSALVNGINVLAVGVWNDLNTSPDLVLVPRLSMSFGPDDTDCLCPDLDGDLYFCTDCDDTMPSINPGMPEVCNDGIDNDCNVATPDAFDADGDSFNCLIDCDDDNAEINPAALEIHCDGIDNDCNSGTPDVVDNDNDFVDCRFDCNDDIASIFPGQIEFCFDGVDNNCDGFIDGEDLECSCMNPIDADFDGFRCTDCNDGNPAINPGAVEVCNDGIDNDCNSGTPDIFDGDQDGDNCDTDCQDFDPAVHAGAIEICNDGIDNDCDTLIDLADPDCAGGDADMDGYDASIDCNDNDAAINPGATEICNDGIDNDCDTSTLDLSDADGDGYDCITDCDDGNPAIHPNAPEDCADLVDNDCDGFIDAVNPDLVLIAFGSEMKYLANDSDPGIGITFTNVIFDDSSWNSGIYGVGYQFGTGAGVQDLAVTTVAVGTVSVYTRANFEISETSAVNAVALSADWDDGYVAWINGVEVYRSPEMPVGVPTWDANPTLHESSNGMVPDYGTPIDISLIAEPLLHNGTNLLVVAIYNDIPSGGGNSSDLIIVPRLSLNFGDDDPDCLCADLDGDGYSCTDCDDNDPLRNPGLSEIGCDLIDNDCDSGTDDLLDADGDGFDCDVDCVDTDATIFPGAPEIACDNINNDCDVFTPDIFDVDLDGYDCQFDCDESDPAINPGMPEIGCDGIDNDCNTLTPDVDDADFDTYRCDQDCNDMDPLVNPGAFEKCDDGIDNDCDTFVDGNDSDCTCPDADGDGYQCQDCNDAVATIHPAMPEVCNDGIDNDCDISTPDVGDVDGDGFDCLADCDDTNPFIRPNAVELCNDQIDNDCNGATDDIVDADGDGYNCDVDCNDNDPAINPGATEVCNDSIDNDCNPSTVDIGDLDFDGVICTFDCNDFDPAISPDLPEVCNDGIDNDCNMATPDIFDADGDGTTCELDCDDMDPTRGLLAIEECTDGIDNDCDGLVDGADPDCACGDVDMDGYSCADCDDTVATTYPGAPEICNDMVDNDCDPTTLDVDDLDNDGFLCTEECDDSDPLAFPSGQEICNDMIDNDCDPGTPDLFDLDLDTYMCDVDCDDNDPSINPGQAEIGCDMIDNDCNVATPDLADNDMDGFTCVDASVRGGAITALAPASSAKVTIVNNTFYNNAMPSGIAGAVYVDDMNAPNSGIVANNIFINNVAELGGAMVSTFFYGDLSNNDFFANSPTDLYDGGGSGVTASANLFLDPQFSSIAGSNFRLLPGSPLIDAGEPTVAPTIDFDRVERPYDGDGDMIALPDIGAFEWPSAEVLGIVFIGPDTMTWQVEDAGDVYNVYRGGLGILRSTGNYTQPPAQPLPEQFCEFPASALPFTDLFDPSVGGTVMYYLVSRRTAAFESSLGNDPTGVLRLNAFPCP